jgi:GLPGLI family protein
MKKLTLTLSLCFVIASSMAQQADKVIARVKYNFTHVRDTNQRNNPYTEQMLLLLGKNATIYTSLDKIDRDLDLARARKAPSAPFKPVNNVDLYFFVKEDKLIARERFMNAYYLVDEKPETINWKITKNKLAIHGISCLQATAEFRGRNWTVWYAPNLPFQSGPWKLNGLPGLIIQAEDERKEVIFEFAGLDNLDRKNSTADALAEDKLYENHIFFKPEIALQKDAQKTTRAEFDKIIELYNKDPRAYISAATGTPKDKIYIGSSSTGESHKIINNPIELPAIK